MPCLEIFPRQRRGLLPAAVVLASLPLIVVPLLALPQARPASAQSSTPYEQAVLNSSPLYYWHMGSSTTNLGTAGSNTISGGTVVSGFGADDSGNYGGITSGARSQPITDRDIFSAAYVIYE